MDNDRKEASILEEGRIEPFTILHDIVVNWWVILLGALAAAMLTYVVVSVRYVPQYTTSSTFVVTSKTSNYSYSNLSAANTMANTFQQILKSNVMRQTIKENLGVDSLDAQISADVMEGTNLLNLRVTSSSPKDAIDIIYTIMENYDSVSIYVIGNGVMNVLEEPQIPFYPDNPLDARGYAKKAFVGAAVFMVLLFGVLSWMRDTIKREQDIEEKLDARGLGIISYEFKYKTLRELLSRRKKALLVNNPIAGFRFVEEYKRLAAKVDYYMYRDDRKILAVTSVAENEGKSTVAANLAISLAEQSKKVLLIDGDLRRPAQFLIFSAKPQEKNEFGEFLKGNTELEDVLLSSYIPNLYLMVGRNCYSTSTDMIHGVRFEKLIESCRKSFDYIIIDSPPAGLMGDAEILASYSDAVMLVARQNYIAAEDINDTLDIFRENHSKVLGVLLNRVQTLSSVTDFSSGRYGHYGQYGNYGKRQKEE